MVPAPSQPLEVPPPPPPRRSRAGTHRWNGRATAVSHDELRDALAATRWWLIEGKCEEVLPHLPDGSVQLIVTSPPYADARRRQYGGLHPDDYVDWFVPMARHLRRILRNDGTFILNIKERVVARQRHTYVLRLILALQEDGWCWTEEFIWHKKNSTPGHWPNRFRDSWERLLQFNCRPTFSMYQEAVQQPIGEWASSRLEKLGTNDRARRTSNTGSGTGVRVQNWQGKRRVNPTNVLHLASECSNTGHPAAFPLALPTWFIHLFSLPGDIVLDPFAGSGTTLAAALSAGRLSVGIEQHSDYCAFADRRLADIRRPAALFAQDAPDRTQHRKE